MCDVFVLFLNAVECVTVAVDADEVVADAVDAEAVADDPDAF